MALTHDTGISQYLKYGTGATADTYAGRVTGGRIGADAARVWRSSVGGKHAAARGIVVPSGSATIEVADKTLISYFRRASFTNPSLTALTFEGACIGDNNYGWTQTGCRINSLDVKIAIGEPLTVGIEWLATAEADQAAPSAPNQSATHFEWFEGSCTLGNTTYGMQSFGFKAENGLEALSTIETKSATTKLLPQDFRVGIEKITGVSIEMLAKPSTSMWGIHADTDVSNIGAVITATSGAASITFTLANLAVNSREMPFEGADGAILYKLEMSGEPNSSTTLVIT